MNKNFIENYINIKDSAKNLKFNTSLIYNSERQIDNICDFLQGNKKVLLLNGFVGTGKSEIVNYVCNFLNPSVLLIRYICFETTILDDMLLSFFEAFKDFSLEGKIIPPRVKAENFTQKINSYFNSINAPIVIVLSSFQSIIKDNKQEILNFIEHLSRFNNIKIIITSRNFNYDEFINIPYERISMLALSKEYFEKMLRENNVKNIGPLSNELYKQTRGYYNYVNLSIKISNFRQWNLGKLLENFSRSMMTYPEYILKEALLLVDPVSLHLFRLLAMIRIPIHKNLLKSLHLYNEEVIGFFLNCTLLAQDGEKIYLKDYYREIIETQIQRNVQIKLHRACIQLYETQLPLKPLERDLLLSRQTMRNEIEYHSLFIPQKVVLPQKDIQEKKEEQKLQEIPVQIEESKEDKIEKINFIFEDENILNDIATSIKDFVVEKTENTDIITNNSKLSLIDILNTAKKVEQEYNYKHAVLLYHMALSKKDDENFDKFLPDIYLKLANVYKNLSDWYNAIEYYTKAQDYYYNISDEEKTCAIKLEMANIYYMMYKQDNVNYILNELKTKENISDELKIKINLALGKTSDNIDKEYNYYKDCTELLKNNTDKSLCAEVYYRFATVNDEKDDIKSALHYYKKCIEISKNNNYLSRAMANIAQLYDEVGKKDQAIKYYEQSIEIDKISKNYNGLYLSEHALFEIYSSKDSTKSLQHLQNSYNYAKKLNEPYYICEISSELGNYYLLREDFENSYKYYVEANNVSKHLNSDEMTEKISSKIDYIKRFINAEDLKKLQEKYG